MKKLIAVLALALSMALGLAAPAQAQEYIEYCPSGLSAVATTDTSCAFADNVFRAWYSQPGSTVYAWSPVTQQVYTMTCSPGITDRWLEAKRCFGINSAGVGLIVYVD